MSRFKNSKKNNQADKLLPFETKKTFKEKKSNENHQRGLTVKVKTARGRKMSSTKWLQRHLNDPFVYLAKKLNYRSRALFKLKEVDEKFAIIENAKNILDLGSAPGSWSEYCIEKLASLGKKNYKIIAVDLLKMEEFADKNCQFIQGDFLDEHVIAKIYNLSDGNKFDLILSDIAPNMTGTKIVDNLNMNNIIENIVEFSLKNLQEGGSLLCKTFQSGAEKNIINKLQKNFSNIKHIKPKSSRSKSAEYYFLAQGFKPNENEIKDNETKEMK